MRNSFVFYGSWWEAIKNLPRDVQGDVLTAIIEYGLNGETTGQLKPIARAMLVMVKEQIDINAKRYENGKKGGRNQPKRNQTGTKREPNVNQTETKGEPNVNVNVNDNDDEKEKVKKEKPVKLHYAPCVLMTEEEYGKLESAHGHDGAEWMVRKLDDYKAASGRTYKSDYRAILNWVVGEYEKHVKEQLNGNGNGEDFERPQARARRMREEEFRRHIEEKLRGAG